MAYDKILDRQTDRQTDRKKERDSGIELLKIFAIFVIVINHVVQTLISVNHDISYQSYVLDLSQATTNIQYIILVIFRHFGVWGNALFFICSAWFLLNSYHYKKEKWFFMLVEIWSVSLIILVISYVFLHGNISAKIIIKSIFPTLFANNWYMTCYLLFYPLHPILNNVIKKMDQIQLVRATLCLTILYIFLNFIKGGKGWFFTSELILWITIYFIMAYMKTYLLRYANSRKINSILVFANALTFIWLIFLTEFGGLHITFLSKKMLHWVNDCNPFIIFMSIGMFNLARNIHFKNRIINYLSGLSLLIYIIHENIILRTYVRPAVWNYVYLHYGYSSIISWVFVLVFGTFLFGVIAAAIYSATIQGFVKRASYRLYLVLRKEYLSLEKKLISIH